MKTACHIINWVYLRPETSMTPYEIWKGRKPTVKYFLVESPCYILRDQENLGKFDTKSDESTFLGYSSNSHAYRVFNHRSNTVIESINVVINDDSSPSKNEMPKEEGFQTSEIDCDQEEGSTSAQKKLLTKPPVHVEKDHPFGNIVGNVNEGLWLRSRVINHIPYSCHLSILEPKKVEKALKDES
jgi:hypothetical protein